MYKKHRSHKDPNYISEDEENGLRLQLLRAKMEKILREQFHKHLPVDPVHLYQHFFNHKKKLLDLKKKGKITKEQFDLLLPTNFRVDSEKFDLSLLITLLFEFCGYKLPNPTWKPDESDRSEIANFVRFRIARNKIQHGIVSVTEKEFDEIFESVKQPMLDFQCCLLYTSPSPRDA